MATQITASPPRSRPALRLGIVEKAVLAIVAVAVIGIAAWSQAGSTSDVAIDNQAYGDGYPLHGGLAGPSRIGAAATGAGSSAPLSGADLAPHYGAGYPLSGGLAGPSGITSASEATPQHGAGYPLNGGLAGPSRTLATVDLARHYGAGYPVSGGLAGPSGIDTGN